MSMIERINLELDSAPSGIWFEDEGEAYVSSSLIPQHVLDYLRDNPGTCITELDWD